MATGPYDGVDFDAEGQLVPVILAPVLPANEAPLPEGDPAVSAPAPVPAPSPAPPPGTDDESPVPSIVAVIVAQPQGAVDLLAPYQPD